MPKISVIIPVYNVEEYLSDCLDSILSQSLVDIEIIGIDDCSTDKSATILNEYVLKDTRIKILHNETNRGPAFSRNLGIKMATGKYVMFVDSDDMITEGSLLALYNKAEESQADGVLFDIDSVYELSSVSNKIAKCHPHRHNYSGIYTGQELFTMQMDNGDLQLMTVICLWKREFILNNGLLFPEDILHEDVPFSVRAFMLAEKMVFLPKSCYIYRRRDNSITTKSWGEKNLIGLVRGNADIILALTQNSANITPRFSASVMEYICNVRAMVRANLIDSAKNGEYIDYSTNVGFLEYVEWQDIYRLGYTLIRGLISPVNYRNLISCKTIIVYGAGKVGLEVINLLTEYGINNYQIAVTKKESVDGNKCILSGAFPIEDLATEQDKKIVIIAVGQKLKETMVENAVRLGFKKIVWAKDL